MCPEICCNSRLSGHSHDEIIRIATFTVVMDNIYSSTNEIKLNMAELVKYPPVNVDLSEIVIKLSVIFKAAIDGFITRNNDSCFEDDIDKIGGLLDNMLRGLSEINEKAQKLKEKIIYYSTIISNLLGIVVSIKDIYVFML